MPFTPTHVAAVVPIAWLSRQRLPFSALVIGSMIPDLHLFVPSWLPITTGIAVALIFALATLLGGARNTAASLDESYHSDRLRAGNLGYWTALVTGVLLWQADLGGELRLAITLTLACLDKRGRAKTPE